MIIPNMAIIIEEAVQPDHIVAMSNVIHMKNVVQMQQNVQNVYALKNGQNNNTEQGQGENEYFSNDVYKL